MHQQPFGRPQYQRPGSAAPFGGQPPPAYSSSLPYQPNPPPQSTPSTTAGMSQGYQWAGQGPNAQMNQSQQQWGQPATFQQAHQSPQQQQPAQTQGIGYNPSTYGPMPGSQVPHSQAPSIPPRIPSGGYQNTGSGFGTSAQTIQQGAVGNVAPQPPPRPYQTQSQPQTQAQSQTGWPQQQQTQYPPQASSQGFQAQAQGGYTQGNQPASFAQQNVQQAYNPNQQAQQAAFRQSSQPQYNASATAFSQAPGTPSYSSGPSAVPSSIQGPVAVSSPTSSAPPNLPDIASPTDAQPAYIPPSLSGQGVAAYMPANTNPLPGVYVPPPPQDVPAWAQAQHPPGQTKKFRYTRPNPAASYQQGVNAMPYGQAPAPTNQQQYYQGQLPMQQSSAQQPAQQPAQQQAQFGQQSQLGQQPMQMQGQPPQPPQAPPSYSPSQSMPMQQPPQTQFAQQQAPAQTQQSPLSPPLQNAQTQPQQSQQFAQVSQPFQQASQLPQQGQQFGQTVQPPQQTSQPSQAMQYGQPPQPPSQAQFQQPQAQMQQHPQQSAPTGWASQPPASQSYDSNLQQKPLPPAPQAFGGVSQANTQQDWQTQSPAPQSGTPAQAYSQGFQPPIQAPAPVHAQMQPPNQLYGAPSQGQPPSHTIVSPESTPVSPIQQRQSISIDHRDKLQRTGSIASVTRKPVDPHASSRTSPLQRRETTTAVVSKGAASTSSALGLGGPSDWEFFGAAGDGDIDDTALYGAKSDNGGRGSPVQLDSVELPAASPPPAAKHQPESTAVSLPDDDPYQPSPPAPAPLPLNIRRQSPGAPQREDAFAPTPSLKDASLRQPHSSAVSIDGGAIVSVELHDASARPSSVASGRREGTGWEIPSQQSAAEPGLRPSSTTSLEPKHAPATSSVPESNAFIMDDGWTPPSGTSSHQPTITASPQPMNSFVMDDGWSAPPKSDRPRHQQSTPREPPESTTTFVMDDGTYMQAAEPATSKPVPSPPQRTVSPQTNFVMDDGCYIAPPESSVPQAPAVISKEDHAVQTEDRPKTPALPPQPRNVIPDLHPWYQDSLERYVTMLRKEASAANLEEKVKVFTGFLASESKERNLDYSAMRAAAEMVPALESEIKQLEVERDLLKSLLTSSKSQDSEGKADEETTVTTGASIDRAQSLRKPSGPAPQATVTRTRSIQERERPKIDATVPATPDDEEEYSPGGRPIRMRAMTLGPQKPPAGPAPIPPRSSAPTSEWPSPEMELAKPQSATVSRTPSLTKRESPDNAAYVSWKYSAPGPSSEQSTAILTPTSTADEEPVHALEPAPVEQPKYKPFRPSEPVVTTSHVPQTVSRPPLPAQISSRGGPQNEIFIEPAQPSPQASPQAAPQSADTTPIPTPLTLQTPAPETALDSLNSLLPPSINANIAHHHRLSAIAGISSSLTSDYSYIGQLTKEYDTAAASRRKRYEEERSKRHEEMEQETNRLFEEGESAYGDIEEIEDEFKKEEIERKAQEEREECQRYQEQVFKVVYDRLQEEVRQLMDFTTEVVQIMREGAAGIEALAPPPTNSSAPESRTPRPTILAALKLLVELHSRTEERHERVNDAVSERNKRYKPTQTQPLYDAGNFKKLKEVQRHFERTEKEALVANANGRLQRTRQLLEVVEEGSRRGMEWDDSSVQATREILGRLRGEIEGGRNYAPLEPDELEILEKRREGLGRARAVLLVLGESEKELMGLFGSAEVQVVRAEWELRTMQAGLEGLAKEDIEPLLQGKDVAIAEKEKEVQERVAVLQGMVEEVISVVESCENLMRGAVSRPTPSQRAGGVPPATMPHTISQPGPRSASVAPVDTPRSRDGSVGPDQSRRSVARMSMSHVHDPSSGRPRDPSTGSTRREAVTMSWASGEGMVPEGAGRMSRMGTGRQESIGGGVALKMPDPADQERERRERQRIALEEAKRRNGDI